MELHKTGKKQVEVKEEKGNAGVATIRETVSGKGNELTSTVVAAGKPEQGTVWIRRGCAKAAAGPFAGEWTEDLSKSRQRQGLVLKIEPESSAGVRFLGDYS